MPPPRPPFRPGWRSTSSSSTSGRRACSACCPARTWLRAGGHGLGGGGLGPCCRGRNGRGPGPARAADFEFVRRPYLLPMRAHWTLALALLGLAGLTSVADEPTAQTVRRGQSPAE